MDPELEQRLKDFDEKKDQEFKEKIAKLDKEWPLEKRNLAITEMKAKQKTEQEWEEYKKEYLDEEDRKEIQPPQKIDEAAYYGLAGDIVKIIEPNSETDPVAILMNFLTAFGSIIGEKPYFEVEASKHRTKLFCVLVGRTSKARKGTSWDYIKYVFDGIDPEWSSQITTGLSSGEGLIWAVRDPIVKKEPLNKKIPTGDFIEVVLDQGIEDKRVLVVEPEFASTLRVLAREGNTLSPNIRNAWDTGRLQSMTKNTPAKAMNSHISILAHITIDELIKYLSDVETTNGFANRFLWFYIQRSKVLPYGGRKDIVALEQFIVKLSDAVEYAKEKEKINFDDETFELWGLLYRKLAEEKPGLIGDMFARSEPYILRLSCIYALLDHSSVIRKEHLLAATAIIDYSLASLEYIFRDSSGNEVEDGILYLLKENEEASLWEINNYFGRHKSAKEIQRILIGLEKSHIIVAKKVLTGGRKATKYELSSLSSLSSLPLSEKYVDFLRTMIKKGKKSFEESAKKAKKVLWDNKNENRKEVKTEWNPRI